MRDRQFIIKTLLFLIAFAVISVACFYYQNTKAPLVSYQRGRLTISDFAYHILLVRGFWSGKVDTIYTLSSQQEVLSEFTGGEIKAAMPIGVSPTALLIWGPFAWIDSLDLVKAYAVWVGFSVTVLLFGVIRILSYLGNRWGRRGVLPVLILVLAGFLSRRAFASLILGQTTCLAAGLLLSLVCLKNHREPTGASKIISVLALLLLSIKIPYLMLGSAVLLLYGKLKELSLGITLLVILVFGLTFKLGTSWPLEYYGQLAIYTLGDIPAAYRESVMPGIMNSVGPLLETVVGRSAAFRFSGLVWFAAFTCLGVFLVFREIPYFNEKYQFSSVKNPGLLCTLFFSIYLLFAPYVGGYEEFLFLTMILVVLVGRLETIPGRIECIGIAALLAFLLNREASADLQVLGIFWALKLLLCVVAGWISIRINPSPS